MFNIGDKVDIISDNPLWKDKSGTILDSSDNYYRVSSDFGNNRNVINYFLEEELSLNETLTEAAKKQKELSLKQQFIVKYLGKDALFKGFDYSQYYKPQTSEEGFNYWSESDLDEIEKYQNFEGKSGKIIRCAIDDDYQEGNSDEDNFDNCYWVVNFNDNDFTIYGKDLTVMQSNKLTEELVGTEDFIGDYLKYIDIDGNEIPAWLFADQIAAAENVDAGFVLEIAKKYKYPCYCLYNGPKASVIITDKKVKQSEIEDEYMAFLPGNPVLEKL